ncbi:hypothetical protein AREALGSMS7_04108 [Arenibacter algicola]|uniref:Uncharacterized protein n=1 Tax=Arenibacter algicola TaxID=616991 RepID=A0A221V1W2_9FLAO|nr:hypothetical protein AREALGSMS7_04108 [Arenibacter algicola]|tara:strand:- start:229 stop:387 length:159 start_codon:yes stop_codon:yes gene_type:complete
MVYGPAAPFPILWGLAVMGLHILELKKNNSLKSKLRETVKWWFVVTRFNPIV